MRAGVTGEGTCAEIFREQPVTIARDAMSSAAPA
jgi:hypothetical protein